MSFLNIYIKNKVKIIEFDIKFLPLMNVRLDLFIYNTRDVQ